MRSSRTTLLVATACILHAAIAGGGEVQGLNDEARGDTAYAARAERQSSDGVIDPANITRAIDAYEAALAASPEDFDRHFKLIEALYFKGHFVVAGTRERKALYARSIELTRHTMELLAARAGVSGLAEKPLEEQAALLKEVPVAARAHFWAGINWGLLGMTYGYLASAREGVAGRIRDHATLVTLLDPGFADGGGCRLLGRLHALTPRIPFVTGWIDRTQAITLLEEAHNVSTRDPRNALFLAEALLDFAPERRGEALDLLREAADHQPDPGYVVEENETTAAARARLDAEIARDARAKR